MVTNKIPEGRSPVSSSPSIGKPTQDKVPGRPCASSDSVSKTTFLPASNNVPLNTSTVSDSDQQDQPQLS